MSGDRGTGERDELREALRRMFHDLRSPLNPVIGFSQLLSDDKAGPLTDQQRKFVNDILAAARQMLAVIEDGQRAVAAAFGEPEGRNKNRT